MFAFQVFENIGMTMGIMPITGIPLPFMSYGGSAIIASFIAIGLVANVHMRRFTLARSAASRTGGADRARGALPGLHCSADVRPVAADRTAPGPG